MELLIGILGAGIGSGIMSIVLACLNRRWQKKDKGDERVNALVTAQKVLMIDRVKHLGKSYIKAGEISLDDKETLQEMYKAYKALGGNGHLDATMEEVKHLRVTD